MPELSIRKIIEKTLSGEIRIPSFQRGFVWEPEKVAFFIDSLYKGYPIGSLLFWRTNIRLENERQLGNYSLPEPTKGYPLDYVLDGQQRITSIFSVFQTELTAVSTVSSWMDIYYILGSSVESQQSQFVPLDANNVDAKKHFPLNCLFDSVKYRKATEHLDDQTKIEVDKLQETFKEIQIPFQLMETDDRAHVAIVFERINRTGVPLDSFQLLKAWSWSTDFDLQEQLDDLSSDLADYGYDGLTSDQDLLLKCFTGYILGSTSPGAITQLDGEHIRANFDEIKNGIKSSVDFIRGELKLNSLKYLPYGVHIGVATQFIKKGDWVHEHNVYDDFEEINREQRAYYRSMAPDAMDYTIHHKYKKEELGLPETIMGYKRADGSFGIRNQVVVISLVQCSNNAAQRISAACNVPATFVDAACGEFPDRFERTRRGFITTGTHPNTFGVVLLSLGCQQTDPEDVAEEIRKTGRPVVNISIQADGGVTKAIQDGIAAVEDLKRQAEAQKREPCPLSGLIIGGYNGGSDWTSGLSANPVVGEAIDMHLSAGGRAVEVCGRGGYPTTAASYEIGMRLMDIGDFFNEDCTRRGGKGLSQVNPTPGNKAGGLTTMTEKNLGSFKTQGHRRILGILDCGDPVPGAGAWGINQAQGANDAYASTTLAMSGCHICLFTTGRGNPIGNACMTTIKITGNPQTATALEDMIDYSAAPMLYGELSLQESGRELYELLLRVANGEETKAEKLGDYSWTTPHGTSYNGDY